jgi:hypothetical protein
LIDVLKHVALTLPLRIGTPTSLNKALGLIVLDGLVPLSDTSKGWVGESNPYTLIGEKGLLLIIIFNSMPKGRDLYSITALSAISAS